MWLPELVGRIAAVMPPDTGQYEVILVNDASPDDTWETIEKVARTYPFVRGIDLQFNVGQFRATICGFERARGAVVITMDDDLQHPPEELPVLIDALARRPALDCIFGDYRQQRHNAVRRLCSLLFRRLNGYLYNMPQGLKLSSFRIMRRRVAEAICAHRTAKPVINPLILRCTRRLGNVKVKHHPRAVGESGYGLTRLIQIALDNLISASTMPLKLISGLGLLAAFGSVVLGLIYLVRYLTGGIGVPGFATLVLLVIFFGGMTLLSIGLLGEYTIRIIAEVAQPPRYMIREEVFGGEAPPPATSDPYPAAVLTHGAV